MNRNFIITALLLVIVSCTIGCTGAHTKLVLPGSHYPVSMSRALEEEDGTKIFRDRIKKVGQFETQGRSWSMIYALVSLTPKTDISNEVNKQVTDAGGNGIVNLRVLSGDCALNQIPLVVLLPIWPGCANFIVRGDIVKINKL